MAAGAFDSSEDTFVWFDKPIGYAQPLGEVQDAEFAIEAPNDMPHMVRIKTFSFTEDTRGAGDAEGLTPEQTTELNGLIEAGKKGKPPRKEADIRRDFMASVKKQAEAVKKSAAKAAPPASKNAQKKGAGREDSPTAGEPLGTCSITRPVDLASPFLMRICARGAGIPNVIIICRKAGAESNIFLEFNMRRSYITKISWDSSESLVNETLEVSYFALGMRYYPQDPQTGETDWGKPQDASWHGPKQDLTLDDTCGDQKPYFSDEALYADD